MHQSQFIKHSKTHGTYFYAKAVGKRGRLRQLVDGVRFALCLNLIGRKISNRTSEILSKSPLPLTSFYFAFALYGVPSVELSAGRRFGLFFSGIKFLPCIPSFMFPARRHEN